MASYTPCPTCGKTFKLSKNPAPGPLKCPSCAQTFEPSPASPRPASTDLQPHPRNASTAEILDRLPTPIWLGPAAYAFGGVAVLLYAMVLFGVVSSWNNRPQPELFPQPTIAFVPAQHQNPEPATPSLNKQPEIETPKLDLLPPPTPEPAPLPKPNPTKPPSDPQKVEVARVAPPPEPALPKDESWGLLSGAPGDSSFLIQGAKLTINIPGSLHILSPELNSYNAPRLLAEVNGDFTALVTVAGKVSPGTEPLPNFPLAFLGAGLLIMKDERNYLRLERTAAYTADRIRLHQVLFEYCHDGKTSPAVLRDARDSDLTLKCERRGSEFRCSYSPDNGHTWLEIKRQNLNFPANLKVGVSAANVSPKPFPARLENFDLSSPGVKPSKSP